MIDHFNSIIIETILSIAGFGAFIPLLICNCFEAPTKKADDDPSDLPT